MKTMHFTFREILARIADKRTVAIWLTVTLVCVIAGPFGTLDMPLASRAIYWVAANAVALILSTAIIFNAYQAPFAAGAPMILKGMIGALAFSVIYAGGMAAAGELLFSPDAGFPDFGLMLIYVAPIAVGITAIVHLFIQPDEAPEDDAAPRILKRLKPGLEARLLRMAMQDHYVEVFTTKGSQLVLMRFADALEEVAGEPGWRVHRSHWVAEAAMRDLKRADGKTLIVTEDGALVPISRTYMPGLKKAGLLQRF